jgi:hypothetical protein
MRSLGTIRARVERLARVQVQREAGEDPPVVSGARAARNGRRKQEEA